MLLNQSARQLDQSVCCGPVYQNDLAIPKSTNALKKALYKWILQHLQVVRSPLANDCLKLSIDGQSGTQLFPKLLLQVSVRELHNIMVSLPEEGGMKEAKDAEDNTIISD